MFDQLREEHESDRVCCLQIMGPVLALTFGVNVHDFRLAALGFVVRFKNVLASSDLYAKR